MSNFSITRRGKTVPTKRGADRWDSFPDFSSIRDNLFFPFEQRFDSLFRDFMSDSTLDMVRATGNYPKLDVYEDGEHWIVKAAVPGVTIDDLSVEILDAKAYDGNDDRYRGSRQPGYVSISGQMNSEFRIDNENTKVSYKELYKSKFRRDIELPHYVEGEPEAELKDGILTLKWKHNLKRPPPDVKKVAIKSG